MNTVFSVEIEYYVKNAGRLTDSLAICSDQEHVDSVIEEIAENPGEWIMPDLEFVSIAVFEREINALEQDVYRWQRYDREGQLTESSEGI